MRAWRDSIAHDGFPVNRNHSHPHWLGRSAIPLTIVCGPPCGGKTTYVEKAAAPGDIVIDLDAICLELDASYQPWSESEDSELFDCALTERNRRLEQLASIAPTSGVSAWFIVAAPTQAERLWWQRMLGGKLALLNPGVLECKRRAMLRGTPQACVGVEQWYKRALRTWSRW